jgi:radical SAM protein with 4Fe4S-binding SPASM domain
LTAIHEPDFDRFHAVKTPCERVRSRRKADRGPTVEQGMFEDIDTDRRPVVLIWEVTQACELACRHCRADAQPARHPEELSTAEGKALLEDAASFGEGQLVVLSGGDPLAREDLLELVSYGDDLGHRMTITPSGTRSLTPERVDDLADAGVRRMALSLDGATAESHDAFRGEASFADTVAAAEAAADEGVPLQINTTVCADTVGELPSIRDRVRELGAVLWSVFFLVPVGRGRVLDPISPERAEAVMEWLSEVASEERFGVKTTEAPFYRRVELQSDGEAAAPRRRAGITAGRGFAFVSHTGEVYPSGFLPESAGNVRERSVVDVYRNADLFESLRDPDGYRGKCGACEFRQVCGGSRSRAYAATGDPLESDPLCPYVPEGYDGPLPETIAEPTGNPGSAD